MTQTKSVLRDLEEAISRGTAESRSRALWHTTDLLIAGRYCEEDVATFGEVIERLADEIELEARAQLAQRLARIDNAPLNVIHKLAFDDAIAVAGPVLELAADEFRRQMEVNVIGPIIATQAFGPLLGADPSLKGKPGRIVMISSVAGKNGNPLLSAYSASKHAIEGLSESLRREMMLFGIDVIIVAPGAVKTPIWAKAEQGDFSVYKNSPFFPALENVRKFTQYLSEIGLPAEKIAERIFHALTAAGPKVRYTITPEPLQYLMAAVLPKRMVDKFIAKRLGLMPPA